MERITLGDNQIASLINGKTIQVKLSDGKAAEISQSLMKDLAAPLINHNNKVYSNTEMEIIKRASSMVADTFKMGV